MDHWHVIGGINGLSRANLIFAPSGTSINRQFYAIEVLPNWFEFLQNDSNFHPSVVRTFMSFWCSDRLLTRYF